MAAVATAAIMASACNTDQLLTVQTPDQIPSSVANSAVGAEALRAAAVGNFAAFYGGDYNGSFHGINLTAGMLADEFESARGGTEHLDSRAQNEAVQPLSNTWAYVGQAHTQIIRAIKAVSQNGANPNANGQSKANQLGQLYALQGFVYVITGENYCNGAEFADANDVNPTYTQLTDAQMFNAALAQFDSAAAAIGSSTAAADVAILNLVAVGRGRAWVDLNDYAKGAAAVSSVPTNFVYNVTYSLSSVVNDIYDWAYGTLNYGLADKEGGNGLPFVTANDPRVTTQRTAGTPTKRNGQDGLPHYVQTVFTSGGQPVPLATGVEARLIEAENALKANDAVTYLAKLNDARANGGIAGLTPLTDPGTPAARVDQLFYERGFWFFGTAHRVGDLRRLVRQYGRAPNTVWPVGAYFKGGSYGNDQVLVPGQAERNNPGYKGCFDMNP
jgi:hypothetical protein